MCRLCPSPFLVLSPLVGIVSALGTVSVPVASTPSAPPPAFRFSSSEGRCAPSVCANCCLACCSGVVVPRAGLGLLVSVAAAAAVGAGQLGGCLPG